MIIFRRRYASPCQGGQVFIRWITKKVPFSIQLLYEYYAMYTDALMELVKQLSDDRNRSLTLVATGNGGRC